MDLASFIASGIEPWGLLIIFPLLFVAGFVDAIGGGGGLISIPAYLFAGLPAHLAIGTNKLSSSMGTAVATFKYARNGYIPWRLSGLCVVTALLGSALGARLTLVASETALMVFMLVAIPIVGFYVIWKKDLVNDKPTFSKRKTACLSMAIAFVVGIYDGFYGPGTGTFLLLLLTGAARLDVFKAAGVTKAINLTTNVTALVVFLANGTVLVGLGLAAGLFNIAGNYLGARLFASKGSDIVRPIILVVLVVFACRLIWQLFG
ncbi:MAG: sulfite exporter TauE/SafE family protein [Coriobacteriales bacterium]|jgi:uncharacterized membrane protein YfcA